MKMLGKYVLNVLIGIDQAFNAVMGGDPQDTYSGRLGKLKKKHGGLIPWYRPFPKLIDWALDKIDPNHSIDAIEGDALRRERDDSIIAAYGL